MIPASLPIGAAIANRFEIEMRAGSGGMGAVYRARDRLTGGLVALKLMHPASHLSHYAERFLREAKVLAELKDPAIVAYVAHGRTEDGLPFLAMEWLEGIDLQQRLANGRLGVEESLALLRRISAALEVIHGHGIVHRDLKPGNIFLRDGKLEQATLLDFGVARLTASSRYLTRTSTLLGTPGYMAPEQASGQRDIRPSADVFSMGCLLYECLTGQRPFVGEHVAAVLFKVLFEEPQPIAELCPQVPPSLAKLLNRIFSKDTAQRPQNAAALSQELAKIVDSERTAAQRSSSPNSTLEAASAISNDIQRLLCVVLASPPLPPSDLVPTIDLDGEEGNEAHRVRQEALGAVFSQNRIETSYLADGSIAVVISPQGSAVDQCTLAAHCALLLQERWPEALVAVATGTAIVRGQTVVGDVIDRAAALLHRRMGSLPTLSEEVPPGSAQADGVRIDMLSARLLESKFMIGSSEGQAILRRGERMRNEDPQLSASTKAPCLGRDQELTMLAAALAGCIEYSRASAVCVAASAGVGKSRLLSEFLSRLAAQDSDCSVLIVRGLPLEINISYGMFRRALAQSWNVLEADCLDAVPPQLLQRLTAQRTPAEAQRMGDLICELIKPPRIREKPVQRRETPSEPNRSQEPYQQAFIQYLHLESKLRPLVLVLEDLQHADPDSIALVASVLHAMREAALRDLPLFVFALARPSARKTFPLLWDGTLGRQILLGGLSRKASTRLCSILLKPNTTTQRIEQIVDLAVGNPFFLEELSQSAAEGKVLERTETVIAMYQARLSSLEPNARRALCAASIFGRTFWRGGVARLIGCNPQDLEPLLNELVDLETIERKDTSRFSNEPEYDFHEVMLHEAAYALLTAADRAIGHQIALTYLKEMNETDKRAILAR